MYPERSTRLRRLLPTRVLFLLTLVMAAATTFVGAPTAWAANVTCTGVMSGDASGPLNIKGNVTVPTDAHCTLSFVNVTGNVQANQGSTLLINAYTEPSTIGGNVEATKCYSALLEGNVTVGGNVQILECHGNGPNGFQGPDIVIKRQFPVRWELIECRVLPGVARQGLRKRADIVRITDKQPLTSAS